MSYIIHHGDCREVMATLDAESVDAIVSDPPYGLSFMGKGWDHGVPGVEFWAEALRVAKPGAHLLAFGGTRTYHRLACAIEDAGWEIRDCVMWVYGSGFPKSHDVSKAIDKAAGAERTEVVGVRHRNVKPFDDTAGWNTNSTTGDHAYTAPATDAARQWSGWGTALKPAWEPIIVARKPLVGTVAENVLTHGTGAINVDGCRVHGGVRPLIESTASLPPKNALGDSLNGSRCAGTTSLGRWPANLIHDGSEEVVGLFPERDGGCFPGRTAKAPKFNGTTFNGGRQYQGGVDAAPRQMADSGSAARFFYCAKASKVDRDEGCEGLEAIHRANGNKWTDQDYRVANGERPPSAESGPRRNHHPTVKPTALMRYLCRLVTPPGGVVLDPFTGSGSTGKGAVLEGFRFIGIEREAEYVEIARARIAAVSSHAGQLF
jgi:site-specific DNA-methyltransferase (adenine-specific)